MRRRGVFQMLAGLLVGPRIIAQVPPRVASPDGVIGMSSRWVPLHPGGSAGLHRGVVNGGGGGAGLPVLTGQSEAIRVLVGGRGSPVCNIEAWPTGRCLPVLEFRRFMDAGRGALSADSAAGGSSP